MAGKYHCTRHPARTEDVDWGKVMKDKRKRLIIAAATQPDCLIYVKIVNPVTVKSRDGRVPEPSLVALLGPRAVVMDKVRALFKGYVSDLQCVGHTPMGHAVYEVQVMYEVPREQVQGLGGWEVLDAYYARNAAIDPNTYVARTNAAMWMQDYERLLGRMANAL